MDPWIQAELDSELAAHWDYISELRAEHHDPAVDLDEDWDAPAAPLNIDIDDDIPF